MPRCQILTDRTRAALFDLPTDEASLLRHYTLADDDIEHIRTRRSAPNKLGFALQLCVFRYPGRLLNSGETIPLEMAEFIAAQIGVKGIDLAGYAETDVTRRRHLIDLREIYGYKMFTGRGARVLTTWLGNQAGVAKSNEDLARRFVDECRRTQTIVPAVSSVERLCADALVEAERRIETRIVDRLRELTKTRLDEMLAEEVEGRVSRFVWLRQFEVGNNSADINRLLDRLEFLQGLHLSPELLEDVPPHRITRLRRQGERYFTDGLRDISSNRRLAIIAVCVVEWAAAIADAIVESHDRVVGKTWRDAKKLCDTRFTDSKTALKTTLRGFSNLGSSLLGAKADAAPLEEAVIAIGGWESLEQLVATASQLTDTMAAEPLAHVAQGFHRFRRYAPRMLSALEIKAAPIAQPLLEAAHIVSFGKSNASRPTAFLRRNSKWRRHLQSQEMEPHRLWEVAVLFHMRDAFRSGDIWLPHSRRYADLKQALVPLAAVQNTPRLSIPFEPHDWLDDRKARLKNGLERLAHAATNGTIPGGSIENEILKLDRLTADVPAEADQLVLDLYRRIPEVRITDLLLDVDKTTGFTDAFTHLRTGVPCKDKIGLLNVLLAEGLNLGLSKMAEASNTHEYFQLSRISRWHIESDAINRALATVIEAQSGLPMSKFWGAGVTASSDGQFFPATRQGEARNLINAKYGTDPGLKAYTHVSDQFGPFATQNIPATVSEAPFILDGLLMNATGKNIKEQYADTGGFTDHRFRYLFLLNG